jgi:RimJ/RimL family protein N-acetyltransferase
MNFSVYIRPLQIDDAKVSYQWRNDPKIWKFTGFKAKHPITLDIETAWLTDVLKREDEKRFAICTVEDDMYIGNVHFANIKGTTAELHVFIGNVKYWGNDRAYDAITLLLAYGFEKMGLDAVNVDVNVKNNASLNLAKKIGFIEQMRYYDEKTTLDLVRSVFTKEMYESHVHFNNKISTNTGFIRKGLGLVYLLAEEPVLCMSEILGQAS